MGAMSGGNPEPGRAPGPIDRRRAARRYNPPETVVLRVERNREGWRLDRFVTEALRWRSRTAVQESILDGQVTLNGRAAKPASRVRPGDAVSVSPRPDLLPPFDPDSVVFETLYEDPFLLAVNKPPHLVVHPVSTHLNDNLLTVLAHRYRNAEGPLGPVVPRLAHRIDANTSGVLLVTLQEAIRSKVARQFARRTVRKEYHALVRGEPALDAFEVDAPLGKQAEPGSRTRRAVRPDGLPSLTAVEVLEHFGGFSLVAARPHTGRTHQIRIHLAHAGHPILADALYGGGESFTAADAGRAGGEGEVLLDRHALHARRLAFTHPVTSEAMEVEAPYPADFAAALAALREREGIRDGAR
jgi:23S rRNA pseudouridine1911/1915/1917 synthase